MSLPRKPVRLPPSEYRGTRIYFVTICCDQRKPLLAKESVAQWIVAHLARSAARFDSLLHAYGVMPNHLHVLVQGTRDTCQLPKFVSDFKQRTGYAYNQKLGRPLWQRHYYDHILRRAEDCHSVAWYIWMNPVRKGICANPHDYQFSGSLTFDWKGPTPASAWTPPWKADADA